MKKVNLMTRLEMKNVLEEVEVGKDFCRFKYKYSQNGSWTAWSEPMYTSNAEADCVAWISAGTNGIVHCGFDCLNS